MAGPESTPVGRQIYARTGDPRVRLSMLVGALLEGGTLVGPFPPGDHGTSFGPFQIHLPAHPGVSRAEAENPAFAVAYMLPAYVHGVARVYPGAWAADPGNAAATAAFYAERPAHMYPASRVDSAMNTLRAGGFPVGSPAYTRVPDPTVRPPDWDWSRVVGATADLTAFGQDAAHNVYAALRHLRR